MREKTKGIVLIIVSAFFFSAMGVFVRLSGDLPFMQKSLFRNAVALVVAFCAIQRSGGSFFVQPPARPYMLLRVVFGTVSILCNYYALDRLALSDASMLSKMSPFFAILFSGLFLRERIHWKQWLYVILAFAGSLLVLKPAAHSLVSFAAIVALIGGISSGFAQTMVRMLNCRKVRQWMIIFCFSLFSTAVTLPFALIGFVPMTLRQVLLLLGAGSMATAAQFCMTKSYSYASAADISIYDYAQIIFSALWGYLFFHQIADGWSYLGYAVIAAAAVCMYFYNKRKADPAEKRQPSDSCRA